MTASIVAPARAPFSARTTTWTLPLLVAASIATGTPARAQEGADKPEKTSTKVDLSTCKQQTGRLSFNFEKATINEVLDHISRIKCMNFILSDAVKGKNDITIVSRSPVSVAQAYSAFLSALEANGMALVPAGAFWKVVERKDAAKTPLPIYEMKDGRLQRITPQDERAGEMPNSDAHVTLLYEAKFASKDQVQNLIRNLMTKNGDLQNPSGGFFILSDSGSNILRILDVLDRVDVAGSSSKLNVVSVQYADAASIATKLQEIFGTADKAGAKGAAVARPRGKKTEANVENDSEPEGDGFDAVDIEKVIADERTNQLLIICSEKAFQRVLDVLRILDQPGDLEGNGVTRIYVVPLANADAAKAASTLSNLAQGAAPRGAANAKAGAKAKEAERAAQLFEGEVKVTADETTNALVVVASPRDYRAMREVIEKLDVRRPQVFVEAAIMEVALTQNRSVGLNAYASAPVPFIGGTGIGIAANEGGRQLFQDSAKAVAGQAILQNLQDNGRLDGNTIGPVIDAASDLSSLLGFLAFQGPPVEILPGLSLPSVGAVLNLLQGNANVDILSTPHLMTTDNEKAEISVGQRVPVVSGIAAIGGAGALGIGLQNNVKYEDVKLKFTITPHVNADGEVRMELEQEVSDLGGQVSVGNGLTQPIITNRSVKTVVVARDQRTIVIGGLIQDRASDTESKVPFFGDIPILGWLFKTWSDNKQKTNLVIVLTPYIVRTEDDFRKIYERKLAERKEFVDAYFNEARVYNPYLDYTKKTGPLGQLAQAIDYEMNRIENGGKGVDGEVGVGPAFDRRNVGADQNGDGVPDQNGGIDGDPPPEPEAGPDDAAPDAVEAPPPPAEAPPPPPADAPAEE